MRFSVRSLLGVVLISSRYERLLSGKIGFLEHEERLVLQQPGRARLGNATLLVGGRLVEPTDAPQIEKEQVLALVDHSM